MGLVGFKLTVPASVGAPFFIHFLLVCTLFAYFPFSKLMHMGGVFLSPTRVLQNNNRERRHVNPWNPKVKLHVYAEYEEEFREKMKSAGLPLEIDPEAEKE
jgi:nitrate reductase gamma subunit